MGYYIIADRELVLGFKLVGVPGTIALKREDALSAFKRVTDPLTNSPIKDVRILILSESVSSMLEDEVIKHQMSGGLPLIVEIPDLNDTGHKRKSISDMIRSAVGISI
ncbi:MAG: V-type ATP synthase subunit F [Spirochaetaceae bacterium]|nr:V-type ATP synthase subunit F [Spirochaetaceae bacterium]